MVIDIGAENVAHDGILVDFYEDIFETFELCFITIAKKLCSRCVV